jgi:hypothetical protein
MTDREMVERRYQRRVQAALPIQVKGVDASGVAYDDVTSAIEVSRRGLSFFTPHQLAVFATLTIVIPGRGPLRPHEGHSDFFTEATVVRTIKEDENTYRVGVRFIGATLSMYSAEAV